MNELIKVLILNNENIKEYLDQNKRILKLMMDEKEVIEIEKVTNKSRPVEQEYKTDYSTEFEGF